MITRLPAIAEGSSYPIRLRYNDPLSTTPIVVTSGTWTLYDPDGEPVGQEDQALPALTNPILFAVSGDDLELAAGASAPADFQVTIELRYNASYGINLRRTIGIVFAVIPLAGVAA